MMTHSKAILNVIAERQRQTTGEGYHAAHDDEHTDRSLAAAGACYAVMGSLASGERSYIGLYGPFGLWPRSWDIKHFKPKDPRRDLVRAAALIVAEIERLDRLDQNATSRMLCHSCGESTTVPRSEDRERRKCSKCGYDLEKVI
jgi:ribosomal protein S27AE